MTHASPGENPVCGYFGLRFSLLRLRELVRLYSYGEFFLDSDGRGRLVWTGVQPEGFTAEEQGTWGIVATADV